jgi:hypothetical protein
MGGKPPGPPGGVMLDPPAAGFHSGTFTWQSSKAYLLDRRGTWGSLLTAGAPIVWSLDPAVLFLFLPVSSCFEILFLISVLGPVSTLPGALHLFC